MTGPPPIQRRAADIARAYIADGFSVIPIRPDGSKAPAIREWKTYQSRMMTEEEIERYFPDGVGIAIICGAASGGRP